MTKNQNDRISASGGSFVNTGDMKVTGSIINIGTRDTTSPAQESKNQVTDGSDHPSQAPKTPFRVQQLKCDRLQREFEQLTEEYQAVSDQYATTLDPTAKVRLKRQLEALETSMEAIEIELEQVWH